MDVCSLPLSVCMVFCEAREHEEATVFYTAEQLTVMLVVTTPCGVTSPVAQLLLRELWSPHSFCIPARLALYYLARLTRCRALVVIDTLLHA
jgi:hypothetical protein